MKNSVSKSAERKACEMLGYRHTVYAKGSYTAPVMEQIQNVSAFIQGVSDAAQIANEHVIHDIEALAPFILHGCGDSAMVGNECKGCGARVEA